LDALQVYQNVIKNAVSASILGSIAGLCRLTAIANESLALVSSLAFLTLTASLLALTLNAGLATEIESNSQFSPKNVFTLGTLKIRIIAAIVILFPTYFLCKTQDIEVVFFFALILGVSIFLNRVIASFLKRINEIRKVELAGLAISITDTFFLIWFYLAFDHDYLIYTPIISSLIGTFIFVYLIISNFYKAEGKFSNDYNFNRGVFFSELIGFFNGRGFLLALPILTSPAVSGALFFSIQVFSSYHTLLSNTTKHLVVFARSTGITSEAGLFSILNGTINKYFVMGIYLLFASAIFAFAFFFESFNFLIFGLPFLCISYPRVIYPTISDTLSFKGKWGSMALLSGIRFVIMVCFLGVVEFLGSQFWDVESITLGWSAVYIGINIFVISFWYGFSYRREGGACGSDTRNMRDVYAICGVSNIFVSLGLYGVWF